MTSYENMATFLESQLDFIFFFYGLAFIILGIVCFFIAKVSGPQEHWPMLGTFASLHGVGEWLDLTALVVSDSPSFSALRIALMAISFALLFEFARLKLAGPTPRIAGRWIHAPLIIAVVAGYFWGGPSGAGAVARYTFGFLGATGTSLVFFFGARRFTGIARSLAVLTATGFGLYALAAGLVVPGAPLWPATVINHAGFLELTGVPIQMVRGMLACVLALLIWAVWSRLLVTEVGSARYTVYMRKQFIWTVLAMAAILIVGWILTEFLGGIYRHNVERMALADMELLSNRFAGETRVVDGMVKVLARTQTVVNLVTETVVDSAAGKTALALVVDASEGSAAWVVNAAGSVVATYGLSAAEEDRLTRAAQPDSAVPGLTRWFALGPDGVVHHYNASMPILSENGAVMGAVILSTSLDPLANDLKNFGRPYFLVDGDGMVALSNRSEALFKPLWPSVRSTRASTTATGAAKDAYPLMGAEVHGGKWTTFDGKREYVLRQPAGQWSFVIAMPTETIFASRLLGIIVTLLAAIMTLIYFAGRDQGTRDSVRIERQRKLQQLARDLHYQATTDSLTGLSNRLKFNEELTSEIARAYRYGSPLTLILFDVDHFKMVNDQYGHQTGDEVLVKLSREVARSVRDSDFLARWGGEEFVILMPGVNSEGACRAALKHAAGIEQHVFDKVGTVTCSFGVAEYCSGETADLLISRADKALYSAKLNGRNRVEMALPAPARNPRSAA